MRLTTIILIATMLQVSASTFGQKITLSESKAPLKGVLKQIRAQSGYDFVYTEGILNISKPVSIKITTGDIEEVLNEIFSTQPLTYTIHKNTITLKEKEKSIIDRIASVFAKFDIRGKITDESGNPLLGANVLLTRDKNNDINILGVTDEYGDYRFINLEEGSYNITVSYVGYVTQNFLLVLEGKDATLNVQMKNVITDLQTVNVVNTGYQSISAERVTGSFDNVNKSQIQKPTKNIAERLIGTTAGMQIRTDANGNPTIQLRGQTTLNANNLNTGNTPLIVVDGFPVRGTSVNPFSVINPNDVESITVLKDAAAASIWGARSSNGVIVITTKRGLKDSPLKVEFAAHTRIADKQDVAYITGLAASPETVEFEQLVFRKWGAQINTGSIFNNFRMSGASTLLNENALGYISVEQLNSGLAKLKSQNNQGQIAEYLLANPLTQQYNLSLSGGSQKMYNYLSLLTENYQTDFIGSSNRKHTINYRTNANVFKWLDFDFSGTFQLNREKNNGADLYDIQQLSPYDLLKNDDGSFTDIYQYYQPTMLRLVPLNRFPYSFNYNPVQDIENRNIINSTINSRIQAGLTFKIIPGLSFNSRVQYEDVRQSLKNYQNEKSFAARNLVNTTSNWDQTPNGTVTRNLPLGGYLDQSSTNSRLYVFRNQANFSKTFSDKHDLTLLAGMEVSNSTSEFFSNPRTYGYDENTLSVGTFPNGVTGTRGWNGFSNNFAILNGFGYNTQRFYSFYSNAAYTYLGRYTISGSYRTDASNLIASDPKYRYSPFYSAGIGYDLKRENFMKNINWLDRLNLRATYGRTGNVDNSTSPFTLISINPAADLYTNATIGRISSQGNPTLTWEKTRTVNIGLDYAIFGNKLNGKIDLYNKKGTDLLASVAIPSVNGSTSSRFNNAGLVNKGIELTLGTNIPLKGNSIIWIGNFTAAYNKGKITSLINSTYNTGSLVQGGSQAYSEGNDPSAAWAYQYGGVVDGSPRIVGPNGSLLPLNSFLSGDGRSYLQQMGTTNPRYILGFVNSFKIYDFDLSFIVTAKLGAVFKAQGFNYPTSGYSTLPNRQLARVLNGDPNLIATLPTNPNENGYASWISTHRYLNYNYLNADLIRLQEVNLNYNLPKLLLSKIAIKGAQLTLQGNNLYTWLANDRNEDPEYPLANLRPRAQFTMGVKIEL